MGGNSLAPTSLMATFFERVVVEEGGTCIASPGEQKRGTEGGRGGRRGWVFNPHRGAAQPNALYSNKCFGVEDIHSSPRSTCVMPIMWSSTTLAW